MSKNRNKDKKVNDDLRNIAAEEMNPPMSLNFQNGEVRAAVSGLIKNDADIMNTIIDVVSDAIVKKLLDNPSFLDTLAKTISSNGLMNEVKQELYESCALDNGRTNDKVRNLEQRVSSLETANKALRDDSDAQEQYSRRNCLLVHGIPEDQKSTTEAVLSMCNNKLGLKLTSSDIDRSHRLGYRSDKPAASAATGTGRSTPDKPRPIIVKLKDYETRRSIFSAKRKLKGSRWVVTENLTKHRSYRLRMARTIEGVTSRWTRDGRIICVVTNGNKETIQTDGDLDRVRSMCKR